MMRQAFETAQNELNPFGFGVKPKTNTPTKTSSKTQDEGPEGGSDDSKG